MKWDEIYQMHQEGLLKKVKNESTNFDGSRNIVSIGWKGSLLQNSNIICEEGGDSTFRTISLSYVQTLEEARFAVGMSRRIQSSLDTNSARQQTTELLVRKEVDQRA